MGILFIWPLLIVMIFVPFLLTQQNTLRRIQPANRSLSPGAVWLQLIPLFGLVWQFIVVSRIAESLSRELHARELTFSFEQPEQGAPAGGIKPTYDIGLAYCILFCFCFVPVPVLNVVASLAGIVCWIIYWVQLSSYKSKLSSSFS